MTGIIFDIKEMAVHDGPGIRTTVFFKGCPLRCKWCHNPETQLPNARTVYNSSKCISCGKCIEICPEHHVVENEKMTFASAGCSACGRCAELCPVCALTVIGERKSVDEVFEEIQKDIHYYHSSGGGVTFSGGECLLYPDFVAELAKKCSDVGIHTTVESAFYVPWKNIESVLPLIDLFYVDLKLADPQKHEKYTGKDNGLILENLGRLCQTKKTIVIRIPIIPHVNDSDEDMARFGEVIAEFGKAIQSVELLKYNYLAKSKYDLIGQKYTAFAQESQTDEQMSRYAKMLSEKTGLPVTF